MRMLVKAAVGAIVLAAAAPVAWAAEVNVYSARQEVLIRPLFDAFESLTGIVVNVVSGKADALLERLKREGGNSPADVLLTTDAGRRSTVSRSCSTSRDAPAPPARCSTS